MIQIEHVWITFSAVNTRMTFHVLALDLTESNLMISGFRFVLSFISLVVSTIVLILARLALAVMTFALSCKV